MKSNIRKYLARTIEIEDKSGIIQRFSLSIAEVVYNLETQEILKIVIRKFQNEEPGVEYVEGTLRLKLMNNLNQDLILENK